MDLFFVSSKWLWMLVQPDHLLLLLLILSGGLILARRPLGHRLMSACLLFMLIITFVPLGQLLLKPLEQRFSRPDLAEYDLAGIIVLGGAELPESSRITGQLQVNKAGERILEIVQLAKQYPELPIIFSGGSGNILNDKDRGADQVQNWLQTLELVNPLMFERDSRNTWQNAVYSRRLVSEVVNQQWLLVTSAAHMPRAVGVFRQQQWSVLPWPVDFNAAEVGYRPRFAANLNLFVEACREWLGLFVYRLTSKTKALLPGAEIE